VSHIWMGVLLFLIAALIALILVYYYARQVKQRLDDDEAPVTGQRASIRVTMEHAERLRSLTSEPILFKQTEEGVRVQIDDKPMLPLAAYMGQEVAAALREASLRVSQAYGSRWTALVSIAEDGSGKVQRLA
jgi:hypothetical protein